MMRKIKLTQIKDEDEMTKMFFFCTRLPSKALFIVHCMINSNLMYTSFGFNNIQFDPLKP